MKWFLLLLFKLFSLTDLAQDLAGLWPGKLINVSKGFVKKSNINEETLKVSFHHSLPADGEDG